MRHLLSALVTNADLERMADARNFIDSAEKSFGRLDIVLANAGVASFAPAEEMSDAMWDDMIDINLSGACGIIGMKLDAGNRLPGGARAFARYLKSGYARHGPVRRVHPEGELGRRRARAALRSNRRAPRGR